jgi:hypothetical protein
LAMVAPFESGRPCHARTEAAARPLIVHNLSNARVCLRSRHTGILAHGIRPLEPSRARPLFEPGLSLGRSWTLFQSGQWVNLGQRHEATRVQGVTGWLPRRCCGVARIKFANGDEKEVPDEATPSGSWYRVVRRGRTTLCLGAQYSSSSGKAAGRRRPP